MININLLPPEIKTKAKRFKQTADIFSICLVIVIVVIVAAALFNVYKSDILQSQLDAAQNDLTVVNNKLKAYDAVQKKALFINDREKLATNVEKSKPAWSQILQDLINSVPSNVQFVSLSADLSKKPNFVLQGITVSERDAIKFKDKLESSSYFKDVTFKSSSMSSKEGEQKLNFSLEFNFETKTSNDKETK